LAKYTTQLKLEVVQQYLDGGIGFRSLGRLRGLCHSVVERWINLYKIHGEAGLEKKFTSYSAAQKLAILRHMWDNELSYVHTAAVFNIRNPGSIPMWEAAIMTGV
jgi:transposase